VIAAEWARVKERVVDALEVKVDSLAVDLGSTYRRRGASWDVSGEGERRAVVPIYKEHNMNTAKDDVKNLLNKLPDDCSLEDIQYHLYVIEKIKHGLQVAEEQGTYSQEEAESRLKKWHTE